MPKWCDNITGSPLTDSNIGGILIDCEILENGKIIEKEILCNYSKNIKTTNIERQNTELTPEEIEKQKKIQALEKALETLKNS